MERIPAFLRKRIERRGGGFEEYVVLRTQFSVILMFFFGLFSIILKHWILSLLVVLLFLLNLYSVLKQLRGIRNHKAYVYFFGGLSFFGLILAFSRFFIQGFNIAFVVLYFSLLAIFILVFLHKFLCLFVVIEEIN